MSLFDWVKPNERKTPKVPTDAVGDPIGPRAILCALEEAVPRYLNDADQGKLLSGLQANPVGQRWRCSFCLGSDPT